MELEPEIRNMVLYDAKLTLERDMEGYVRAYQLVKNGGFGSRVITIGWL